MTQEAITAGAPVIERPTPSVRFWSVVVLWFAYGPIVTVAASMIALARETIWLLTAILSLLSLGWVVAGYRRAQGSFFGPLHAAAVVVDLSVIIAASIWFGPAVSQRLAALFFLTSFGG